MFTHLVLTHFLFNSISLKSKSDSIVVCKIFVISVFAIYLLGDFTPFYEAKDALLYGIESKLLSEGTYEISNPLFEETQEETFTGSNWNPTIRDTMVPAGGVGTPILGATAYVIGGHYGLFYIGPALGILLLIIYERISTNLFGKYVGFLALLFLASCHILFRSALLLNTDAMLTLFFIPGIYYLIKFLRSCNENKILFTSIFFVIASLIKNPAMVYFPLEIITVIVYFVVQLKRKRIIITTSGKQSLNVNALFVTNRKKILKLSLFVILPWIAYFAFWFSYNDYYYGSPTTTYYAVTGGAERSTPVLIQTLFTLEHRDYEQFKDYSKYLLPYQIPATYSRLSNNLDITLGQNWPGLITLPLVFLSLFISFRNKSHRIEFLVFTFFILGILWFYSGQSTEERAESGLPARFMLPAISLTFLVWSYMIVTGFGILKTHGNKKNLRIFLIIILGIFFIFAFYFTPPIQFLVEGKNFKNPAEAAERYPLDKKGFSEKTIILAKQGDFAIEYGAIPFKFTNLQNADQKINLLEEVMREGYHVYTFKESVRPGEKDILKYIINKHDFVLKDFSRTFCKLYVNNGTLHTDNVCIDSVFQSDESKKYEFPFLN